MVIKSLSKGRREAGLPLMSNATIGATSRDIAPEPPCVRGNVTVIGADAMREQVSEDPKVLFFFEREHVRLSAQSR